MSAEAIKSNVTFPLREKEPEKKQEEVKIPVQNLVSQPLTIMTENDAYISERMKDQPQTLDEIEVTTKDEKLGIHRLSLPDYFEQFSYDCTVGTSCSLHGWTVRKVQYGLEYEMDRWEQTKRGKYVFRWLYKAKRALDLSINIKGWYLVNKTVFRDAPKILFSVNGGVENGDSILGFMPVSKALKLRTKPADESQDRVSSEEKKHEGHPSFYKAKLSPERVDGDDYAPPSPDAIQEGRDF